MPATVGARSRRRSTRLQHNARSFVPRCRLATESLQTCNISRVTRHAGAPTVLVMLARVNTFSIDGLETSPVTVEVDIRPGLPAFSVVGLGDTAIREARERVRAGLLNSGFEFPDRRIVANLAPASIRKGGSS